MICHRIFTPNRLRRCQVKSFSIITTSEQIWRLRPFLRSGRSFLHFLFRDWLTQLFVSAAAAVVEGERERRKEEKLWTQIRCCAWQKTDFPAAVDVSRIMAPDHEHFPENVKDALSRRRPNYLNFGLWSQLTLDETPFSKSPLSVELKGGTKSCLCFLMGSANYESRRLRPCYSLACLLACLLAERGGVASFEVVRQKTSAHVTGRQQNCSGARRKTGSYTETGGAWLVINKEGIYVSWWCRVPRELKGGRHGNGF
jgi:hypothetical protein